MSERLKELLGRLENDLHDLMYMWDPSDNSADYVCGFCLRRPPRNGDMITHRDDCLGEAFRKFFAEENYDQV